MSTVASAVKHLEDSVASSEIDVQQFERRLSEERDAINSDLPKASELAELFPRGDVLDPEDISVNETERDVQLGFANRRSDRLVAIDEALNRIHDGTFGRCVECGGAIGAARLEADPAAGLCIECQRRDEERNPARTPVL